jgi:hypothetical protein
MTKKAPEKLNIEMSISSEHSCYVSVKDYTIYVEVSQATNNKPYISFWKKGGEDDRAITLSH